MNKNFIRVKAPDGKSYILHTNITYSEKQKKVEELTEYYLADIESSTAWETNAVRLFMDSLTSYLLYDKSEAIEKATKELIINGDNLNNEDLSS